MVNTKKNSGVTAITKRDIGHPQGLSFGFPPPGCKLASLQALNTNYIGWSMHALTMAQGGPAREAASSGRKLSSLTGPWIWDIVGLRKMKRALMRSSMRAAQGPWLRDENIAPGIARHWRPRTRVITSVYKLSNQPTQSASPQAKGSSFKPEATSSKILEPGYKRTSLGSGAQATRTNEFLGCFTKKLIWWGDRRILCTNVYFNSTRKKFPLGA